MVGGVSPGRETAWLALSDLFLDTDLDEADIASIAARLRATGIGVEELERIYVEEVAPVCWRNLRTLPGGAWSGFEPSALRGAIEAHLQHPPLLHRWDTLHRLRTARWTADTRADWGRVRRLLA